MTDYTEHEVDIVKKLEVLSTTIINVKEKLDEYHREMRCQWVKIDSASNRLAKMEGKASFLGAVGGGLVALILKGLHLINGNGK